jgi:hypothetical protein
MHVSIRKYVAKDTPEIVSRAQEGFLPIVSAADGFIEYYLVDAGEGTLVTVSVFEDLAGANRSVSAASEWVRENLLDLVEGPPEITMGEVRVHGSR